MRLQSTGYTRLTDRADRLTAHIAARARLDTIHGGARALTLAKRLLAMGGTDLGGIISDVYSASTGNWSKDHEAWECPECGQAHLGQDAAFECCAERFDEADEELSPGAVVVTG